MKNKLYRINHRPSQNVEMVVSDIHMNEALERKWKNQKSFTTMEDKINFDEGIKLGIQNIEISDKKRLDNIFFKRGYLLGKRKYAVLEEQQIKEQILDLVNNNVPLEECPEFIQNDERYSLTYKLEKTRKQRNKM